MIYHDFWKYNYLNKLFQSKNCFAHNYSDRFTIGQAQVEKKYVNGILKDMSFETIPKEISN